MFETVLVVQESLKDRDFTFAYFTSKEPWWAAQCNGVNLNLESGSFIPAPRWTILWSSRTSPYRTASCIEASRTFSKTHGMKGLRNRKYNTCSLEKRAVLYWSITWHSLILRRISKKVSWKQSFKDGGQKQGCCCHAKSRCPWKQRWGSTSGNYICISDWISQWHRNISRSVFKLLISARMITRLLEARICWERQQHLNGAALFHH